MDNLYKIKINNVECCYDVYSDFVIIADSKHEVHKLIKERCCGLDGKLPDYILFNGYMIIKIGEVQNILPDYKNKIILANFINP